MCQVSAFPLEADFAPKELIRSSHMTRWYARLYFTIQRAASIVSRWAETLYEIKLSFFFDQAERSRPAW